MVTTTLPRQRAASDETTAPDARIAAVRTSVGQIRLALHREFETIRNCWIKFQQTALCSHAQTFAWSEAWFRLVAAPAGAQLSVICGTSESGRTLFIWPFEKVRVRGLQCLRWIGQDQSNYNMGLYDLDFARRVQTADIKALLEKAAHLAGNVSAAEFHSQPVQWDGLRNPLSALPHRPAASSGYAVILDTDFDTLYRNRFSGKSRNTLRRKERHLATEDPVSIGWADSNEERSRILDVFFEQKTQRFAEMGIADAFADANHRAFYREMALLPRGTQGRLDVGYLSVGNEIAATLNGVRFRNRYSILLSSIQEGRIRRYSPGSILLRHQIKEACREGFDYFDMGAGNARHKAEWCSLEIPLFESFIAFNEAGWAITLPLAAQSEAKRFIKTRPALWTLAQSVRRRLFGRASSTAVTADRSD